MMRGRKKTLIGFIPYGGLGNQLFQYATALSLRKEEDFDLAIDLIGRARANLEEMPEIMDFEIEKISPVTMRKKSNSGLLRALIELQLRLSNKSFKNCLMTLALLFFQRLFSYLTSLVVGVKVVSPRGLGWDKDFKTNQCNFTLLGNFHSYLYINDKVRSKLKGELKSRDNSGSIKSFQKLAVDEKPVAVHIRLGDYLSVDELNVVSKDYFARSIAKIESKKPDSNYWIFTNDESLSLEYLPSGIIGRSRFIPQSLNSAETMEVMWLCDTYIISNSTFSWWGAFLSVCDKPLVIAPKKWFKNLDDPVSICPPEWVRL
jgi:hypothetical protein